MVQATWPFASLTIYEDSLVLKVAWHTAELKMSEIVAIKRMFFFPVLADGIEIIHKNENLPGVLVFWSFGHGREIKDLIESKRSIHEPLDSSSIPALNTESNKPSTALFGLPFTFYLLLPVLFFSVGLLENYAIFIFLPVTLLSFLIETRLRFGNVSRESIAAFFNTRIQNIGMDGKPIIDNSPRFSILRGIAIIICGAILAMLVAILIFGVILA